MTQVSIQMTLRLTSHTHLKLVLLDKAVVICLNLVSYIAQLIVHNDYTSAKCDISQ